MTGREGQRESRAGEERLWLETPQQGAVCDFWGAAHPSYLPGEIE